MKFLLIVLTSLSMNVFAQEGVVLDLLDSIKDEVRYNNHERRVLARVRAQLERTL